jgi:hypothetical protein
VVGRLMNAEQKRLDFGTRKYCLKRSEKKIFSA